MRFDNLRKIETHRDEMLLKLEKHVQWTEGADKGVLPD
jgi:hypothetical protein